MTKPVTGVALILYEEGKWRIDDPVSKYVPEFRDPKVHAGENADGTPKLEDPRHPMTMRELMTQPAGLGYELAASHPVDRMFRTAPVIDPTASLPTMMQRIGTIPLLAQPGTRWSYSIAVDVQGYIVEKLSGRPFDVFLKERIFDPLGMKDTAFYVPAPKLSRLAQIHTEAKGSGLEVPDDRQGGLMTDPTTPPGVRRHEPASRHSSGRRAGVLAESDVSGRRGLTRPMRARRRPAAGAAPSGNVDSNGR